MNRAIYIKIEKCHGHDYCEDDQAIHEYFKNSWVAFLHNKRRFDVSKYGAKSIIQGKELIYQPISTQVQLQILFAIERTEVNLQDLPVNMDEVTLHAD